MRDHPGVADGRSNDIIAPSFLGMQAQTAVLFSPPRDDFSTLDYLCKIWVDSVD
jgi:hypothetical protein